MNVTIDAADLARSLRVAGTAVNAQPTQPVLAGVLMSAESNRLELAAFDFESSARSRCNAVVTAPGVVLVSHRLLASVCSLVRSGEMQVAADENGPIVITAGRAVWRLPQMRAEDFPTIPSPGEVIATVHGAELAAAVDRVALAAATPDNATGARLDCIHVAITTDGLQLAATDRYRVHVADVDAADVSAAGEFVLVDARRFGAMVKHLHDGQVTVRRSDALLALSDEGGLLTTRRVEPENGQWVQYGQFFERMNDPAVTVRVGRNDLAVALRQVAGFGGSSSSASGARFVTLTLTDAGIELHSGTDAEGSGAAAVDSSQEGDGLRVCVNGRFCSDALEALPAPIVRLTFVAPTKPMALAADNDPASVILMPIRHETAGWVDAPSVS